MSDHSDDDRQRRIVEARLRLRERHLAEMLNSPALADAQPLRSGPPNRHGMPRIPVGQTPTAPRKWPVLDLGIHPLVPVDKWSLPPDHAAALRLERRQVAPPPRAHRRGPARLLGGAGLFHSAHPWRNDRYS